MSTVMMFAKREKPRPQMFRNDGGPLMQGQRFVEPFDPEARRIYEEN